MDQAIGVSRTSDHSGRPRVTEVAPRRNHGRLTLGRFVLLIVLSTVAIEALLVFRAWVQLSGWQLDVSALRLLYDLSGLLVGPFRGIETTAPIRRTDILELSTMVAVEVYLIIAVLALGLGFITRALARRFTVHFERDGVVLNTRPERQAI